MLRQTAVVAALSLAAAPMLAAPAAPAASAVYPGGETAWEPPYEPSTVTRAQVIAELQRARRSGEIRSNYEIEPAYAGPSRPVPGPGPVRQAATPDYSIYLPNA